LSRWAAIAAVPAPSTDRAAALTGLVVLGAVIVLVSVVVVLARAAARRRRARLGRTITDAAAALETSAAQNGMLAAGRVVSSGSGLTVSGVVVTVDGRIRMVYESDGADFTLTASDARAPEERLHWSSRTGTLGP
jgi:hypothetical protein